MASERVAHWFTSHTTVHTGLVYSGSSGISTIALFTDNAFVFI